MDLRLLLALAVSLLHPPFPPAFELSSSACRIFNRSAFSQENCGACTAFAVSTAYAMRECVQRGRDVIPSPHRLFDCCGGRCEYGSSFEQVIAALGGVMDADEALGAFGLPCAGGARGASVAAFALCPDNALLLKTELFVYRNPVLAVIHPDEALSLYPGGMWRGGWMPFDQLPVYRVTGDPLKPHAVVVLGWGSAPEPHWVIQNSWGDDWGARGRGRVAESALVAAVVLDSVLWKHDWAGFALFVCTAVLAAVVVVDEVCGEGVVVVFEQGGLGSEMDCI
jgi:hypothetical protein